MILYVKGTINTYFYSEYYLHIILLVKTTYIAIPVILRWRSLKKQPCEAFPNKHHNCTTFHLLDQNLNVSSDLKKTPTSNPSHSTQSLNYSVENSEEKSTKNPVKIIKTCEKLWRNSSKTKKKAAKTLWNHSKPRNSEENHLLEVLQKKILSKSLENWPR